jgi:hypothetical protein
MMQPGHDATGLDRCDAQDAPIARYDDGLPNGRDP